MRLIQKSSFREYYLFGGNFMENKKMSINSPVELVAGIIAVLCMFFFGKLPAVDPITPYGMTILGIFIGAVVGWCFGGANTLWVSLLGIVALGTTNPAGVFGAAAQVLGGYVFIIIFFSLFFVGALMGGEICEYLVWKVLTLNALKGHPWRFIAAIFIGSYVIGIFTNPIVIAIFLFLLYNTLFEQVGYQPGEKTPVMLVICTAINFLVMSILWPWSAPQLMAISTLSAAAGLTIANSTYIIFILLFSVVIILTLLAMLKILGCDVDKLVNADLTFLTEKYKNGMSAYQKAILTCMLIYVLGSIGIAFFPKTLGALTAFVTGTIGFPGWSAFMAAVMMFIKVDGKQLIEPVAMAKNFPWDMLMMIGFAITIGTTLASEPTGVTAYVGKVLGPILGSAGDVKLGILLLVSSLILTNFLNNNAIIILFSTMVVTLFVQGIITNPIVPIILVIIGGEFGFLTPSASIYGAFIHGHKYVTSGQAYKYGIIMMVVMALVSCLVGIPLGNILF